MNWSTDIWNLLWSHLTYEEMDTVRMVCWDWYEHVYRDSNPRKHLSVLHGLYGYENQQYIEHHFRQYIQNPQEFQMYPIYHNLTDRIHWERRGMAKSLITSYYWPSVSEVKDTRENRYRVYDLSTGKHIWEKIKPMTSKGTRIIVNSNHLVTIYQSHRVEIWNFLSDELMDTIHVPKKYTMDIDYAEGIYMKYHNDALYILGPKCGIIHKDGIMRELKYTRYINEGYVLYTNIIHDHATEAKYNLLKIVITSATRHICNRVDLSRPYYPCQLCPTFKVGESVFDILQIYQLEEVIHNNDYFIIKAVDIVICSSKGAILWTQNVIDDIHLSPDHPHLHTLTSLDGYHQDYIIIDLATGKHLYHSSIPDEHAIAYIDRNIVIFECNYFTDLEYYLLDDTGIPIYTTTNYRMINNVAYPSGATSWMDQTEIISYGQGYLALHSTKS